MKYFFTALVTLVLFSLLFTSCKKDDPEPQFELVDIFATWEVIGGTDFIACPAGDNMLIEISDTEVGIGGVNDEGCASGMMSVEYEYVNGNTFKTGLFQLKVTSLNGTEMTATLSSFGTNFNYELQKMP